MSAPGWSAAQRGVLIVFLALLAGYLGVRLFLNPEYVSNPQPTTSPRTAELEDRLDPNTVDWPALAALPLIGETRAKQIIAYREQFVRDHPGQLAFNQAPDMMHIRGIGTATLAQIEPYLLFPVRTPPTSSPD